MRVLAYYISTVISVRHLPDSSTCWSGNEHLSVSLGVVAELLVVLQFVCWPLVDTFKWEFHMSWCMSSSRSSECTSSYTLWWQMSDLKINKWCSLTIQVVASWFFNYRVFAFCILHRIREWISGISHAFSEQWSWSEEKKVGESLLISTVCRRQQASRSV